MRMGCNDQVYDLTRPFAFILWGALPAQRMSLSGKGLAMTRWFVEEYHT